MLFCDLIVYALSINVLGLDKFFFVNSAASSLVRSPTHIKNSKSMAKITINIQLQNHIQHAEIPPNQCWFLIFPVKIWDGSINNWRDKKPKQRKKLTES